VGLNRQVCRSLSIALFAGASMMLLALMSMFSVPISRADNPDDALNTLMMGGTTMPTPSEGWQDAIITDYIDPATGGNYTLVLVPTPESLAPTSVPTGLADLQAAIAAQQLSDPGEPFLVEGFVPTTELPLLDPLRSLGVPESVLNIIQPELQVIVEAGYDRSIPFGDPTPAELIPSIDPVTFLLELANGDVQGANNAFELFGGQLPDFTALESFFTSAEAWSETNIGVPYDQVVTELNNAFDPFTAFSELEGAMGTDIDNMLEVSGMQQDVLDPILGLVGTVGGIFTS
jgi:hypothetical protein